MRIAFVNRGLGLYRGGGEMVDLRMARALVRLGHDVRFVAGAPLVGAPIEVDAAPVLWRRTPYLRGLAYRLPWAVGSRFFQLDLALFERSALRALAEDPPEIVQILGLARLADAVETRLGLPAVLRFPGPPDPWDRDKVRRASAVFANGDAFKVIARDFRDDAVEIFPGVDVDLFRPGPGRARESLGVPAGAPLVLYVGRLVPIKDVAFLISGFAGLRQRLPDARLAIVGEGPLRAALEAQARAQAPGAVHFAGAKAETELPDWYNSADAVAITSSYENYPNALLEALACGRPVVGTRVGGVERLVEGRGQLVPHGDREALANALHAAVTDPGREEAGRRSRDWIESNFSWEASARKLLAVYEAALAKKGKGAPR